MINSAKIRAQLEHPVIDADGYFGVIDMSKVVEKAYELVDEGDLTDEEFRSFAFNNVVQLHAALNPNSFKGTTVDFDVRKCNGRI